MNLASETMTHRVVHDILRYEGIDHVVVVTLVHRGRTCDSCVKRPHGCAESGAANPADRFCKWHQTPREFEQNQHQPQTPMFVVLKGGAA
ncbi:hypothetical protein [Variovorax paradoxus]|uniref:hypothetical protein n=1 Tax=Variovorax paradoxus TaxID=34073 RepID=UPI0027D7F2BB|nr:hypothetical protein [Variovorax paradoxus]